MRIHLFIVLMIITATCFQCASPAMAGVSYWGMGVRQHVQNELIQEYPFVDNDTSFGLVYEYHDLGGFWLLTLDYASGLDGTNGIKEVLTPSVSLVMTENNLRLGLGIQKNYLKTEEGKKYWNDIHWQLLAGYKLQLAGVTLDLYAFMPFESFSDLKVDTDYFEYGISMVFKY